MPLIGFLTVKRTALPTVYSRKALAKAYIGIYMSVLYRYDETEPLLAKSVSTIKPKYGKKVGQTKEVWESITELYDALNKHNKGAEYRSQLKEIDLEKWMAKH